jgi:hypothetical protein
MSIAPRCVFNFCSTHISRDTSSQKRITFAKCVRNGAECASGNAPVCVGAKAKFLLSAQRICFICSLVAFEFICECTYACTRARRAIHFCLAAQSIFMPLHCFSSVGDAREIQLPIKCFHSLRSHFTLTNARIGKTENEISPAEVMISLVKTLSP